MSPKRQRDCVRPPIARRYGVPVRRLFTAPDNWTCPICARQKRQILRMSNAKKWSGSIREIQVFTDERDEDAIANRLTLYADFSNEKFVRHTAMLEVCSDCADLSTLVGQRDRSLVYPILTPDDIRATILAIAPHAAHEIDYDAAIARARANEPYASALQAFNSFRSRASDFAVRFALLNRRGVEADAILEEFTEDVKVFHCIDDPAECRRLADWLLEEGRRFHRGSDTRGTGTFEGAMAGAFGSDRLRRTSMPWRSLLDREWRTIFIRSRRCAGCGLPRGLRPALSTTLGRSSVARRSPIEVP